MRRMQNTCTRRELRCRIVLLVFFWWSATAIQAQNLNNPNKPGPLGIQVNTLSGNVFIPRTDIYIPARGFDLNIQFYYNSVLYNEEFNFGKGWTFEYNIRYRQDTIPGAKLILWGDGREDQYDSIPGGGYKTPRGFFNTFTQYQPGKFLLAEPTGKKYFFDNAVHKHITRLEEPNGNYINFTYSDSLLTAMTNAAGQTISFTYNAQGRLATLVDAMAVPSRTFTYTYDAGGNLKEVKDPLNYKYQYTYLVNGPMKSLSDKNNNKVDIIYFPDFTARELIGCNKRLSFSYDTISNITFVTDHLVSGNQVTKYTYKKLENLSWITSMSGNCCGFNESYEYDDQGNRVKMTDANGQVYSYTYDSTGNMLTVKDPLNQVHTFTYTPDFKKISSYRDAKGNLYTMTYDTRGNLTQLVAPGNNIYTASYNANGDIISSTDPNGNTYSYIYDSRGNPTSVTGPGGYHATLFIDARGNLLSFTDARGHTTTAEYDILNRMKKITDPINNTIQFTYDAAGNPVNIKNKNNEASTLSFDASNRLVQLTDATGNHSFFTYDGMNNLLSVKNALGNESKMSYDSRNRLKGTKDADNNSAAYTYDGNGNILTAMLPNGRQLSYSYDALNRLTGISDATSTIAGITYDKNGNIISVTNATGAVTTATYDSLDRLKSITDPLGNSSQFAFDKNNNLLSLTDREGHTRFYTYDSLNRMKTWTDNNGFVITIGYDTQGNITSLKDQNNNTTSYTYDSLNRRKRMTFPDGNYTEFTYDKENNITAVRRTDASVVTYQYDTLNRITSRTLPGGEVFAYTYDKLGRVLTATNNNGTVTFTYDKLNRVISENFDGRTVRYSYNVSGRTQTTLYPDSTSVVKQFDTRNRLIKILKDSVVVAEYSYNNANQLTQRNFANGVSTSLQYDFANRMSSLTTTAASGVLQNSQYSYDKEYNKTAITRNNNLSLSEQFSYDNGYRIIDYKRGPAGSPVVHNTYTYDAVGNRSGANLNGTATTYSVNNLNQLTGVNSTSFTFDARGNLTYDGTFYKTYDGENRLVKDSSSPASVITYGYDAINRRVVKTINGNTLKYTYSFATPIEERSSSNILLNRTIFNSLLSPVMNEKDSNIFFYHPNELGSVEALSNSSGRLTESYRYDVYGKLTRFDSLNNPLIGSPAGNRFGFTGQEYDSATGSYRFFYRNYSPETGVFNQRDLIEYEDGMGMYQYVGNNPANGVDTWGLNDCPEENSSSFDFWSVWDTGNDIKSYIQAAIGVDVLEYVPKGVSTPINVVSPYADLYKTATSINAASNTKSVTTRNMHGGDAVKNGTNATLGLVSLGGTVYAGAEGAAAGSTILGLGGTATEAASASAFAAEMSAGSALATKAGGVGLVIFALDKESVIILDLAVTKKLESEAFMNDLEVREYMWKQGKTDEERVDRIMKLDQLRQMQAIRDYLNNNPCPPVGGSGRKFGVRWDKEKKMFILFTSDPNLIKGPDGEPAKAWVSVKDRMPYTIFFENDTTATAPVKYLKITSPVEPKQDAATLELGSVGFNNFSFDVPPGNSFYYQRLDARDSMGLYIDMTAGYDIVTNNIFWEFQAIDPITLLPPEDPLAGFLFVQDTLRPEYGHGFVNFSIKPRQDAQTLDTIGARAFILFDQNDTIPTNIHTNTIDAVAPTSSIANLPDLTPDTVIPISYTGTDDPNGSGVKWFSVYVSDNNGPPELYLSNITVRDTVFNGLAEHTYQFYISATDTAGNVETLRLLDSVKVTTGQNIICPGASVSFDSKMTGATFQWQVDDGTGYTNITDGGVYSSATTAILGLTAPPTSMYGYKFRCLVNGTAYSLEFILKFGMTWEGTVSTAWEDPANWSCNTLPDMNTDVIINGGKPNYPVIASNPVIRTLRLNAGASGTVTTGFSLTVLK